MKVVLVSSCGYWELDNFDLLQDQIKAFCGHAERKYAGALLRPHGPALRPMMEQGAPVTDIFDTAREAGHQLITNQEIRADTLAEVSRALLPFESYVPK